MTEEIVDQKEPEELEIEFIESIVTKLADTNKAEYNVLKLAEELAELQERLLKFHNKTPDRKPKAIDIAEELGDVLIRIAILLEANGWEELVKKRVSDKIKKLSEYYESGKYVGGV